LRNRSLGFRRIPSNNWAFSGLRLEFTSQERPRSNKDSVTSGNFTGQHPEKQENHETIVDPRDHCWGTRVEEIRRHKTVETWLNNVKPSTAKPYLYFRNRFCQYAQTDPDR
jgi:hypothetical protein